MVNLHADMRARIVEVGPETFAHHFGEARRWDERVRAATSSTVPGSDSRLYLTQDYLSGFAVSRHDGELTHVFSRVKGRGDALLIEAIELGAWCLDCFDGYLPEFYARHGFREVRRVPNWTPGEPDVVFMER